MGELLEYYVILSIVEYVNDPLKMGRIKCNVPGVMHTYVTEEDALPWIRPFSMNAYQSFSKPIKGQKVWVLASKTNLNEFWWFPYFETTDFTQDFLDTHYDMHPDVLHSREHTRSMLSYDDVQGYMIQCGKSYINIHPESIDMKANSCHVKISGDHILLGQGADSSGYSKVANAHKLKTRFNKLGKIVQQLNQQAAKDTHTFPLCRYIQQIENVLSGITNDNIACDNVLIN